MNINHSLKGDKTMQPMTELNRLVLGLTKPHRFLTTSVFASMLLAGNHTYPASAEQLKEQHATMTMPPQAVDAKASIDTNLALQLQEDDFWVIEDEPVNHLARAVEALNKHDATTAGSELRKAAFFVKAHATRAEGTSKSDLRANAAKLENLARRVEQGLIKSQDHLATALATTYLNLARYHYLAAVREQAKHDFRAAKHDLTMSADYVESHLKTAGGAVDLATQNLLADVRKASQSIEMTANQSETDTGRVLESLGRKIQELGHNLANNNKDERFEEPAITHNVAHDTQPKGQP
jgi:hypothetical protein